MARLRRPLSLTWAGLIAERLVRAFWPVWSLIAAGAALLMLGLHDIAPVEAVWSVLMLGGLALVVFAGWGAVRFRFPRRAEAAGGAGRQSGDRRGRWRVGDTLAGASGAHGAACGRG